MFGSDSINDDEDEEVYSASKSTLTKANKQKTVKPVSTTPLRAPPVPKFPAAVNLSPSLATSASSAFASVTESIAHAFANDSPTVVDESARREAALLIQRRSPAIREPFSDTSVAVITMLTENRAAIKEVQKQCQLNTQLLQSLLDSKNGGDDDDLLASDGTFPLGSKPLFTAFEASLKLDKDLRNKLVCDSFV